MTTELTAELLANFTLSTLESMEYDLELTYDEPSHSRAGEIAALHDFIEDVEEAIKKRIVPIEPPTSSGSLAQVTGLLKND